MGMDRVQTFVLHDKVIEKLEKMTVDYGYTVPQLFNIGIQVIEYLFKVKDKGWEVGAYKILDKQKGINLKTITFPHEEGFVEGNVHEPSAYADVEDDDEDDDDDDWLDISWRGEDDDEDE